MRRREGVGLVRAEDSCTLTRSCSTNVRRNVAATSSPLLTSAKRQNYDPKRGFHTRIRAFKRVIGNISLINMTIKV